MSEDTYYPVGFVYLEDRAQFIKTDTGFEYHFYYELRSKTNDRHYTPETVKITTTEAIVKKQTDQVTSEFSVTETLDKTAVTTVELIIKTADDSSRHLKNDYWVNLLIPATHKVDVDPSATLKLKGQAKVKFADAK